MSSRRDSDFARLEQLLEEERRNRQQAEERAQLERERADGERKRAQDEQRRAEDEHRRAEDERRRAEEEQRSRQEAEKKTRPTSFNAYIRACHSLLSKPLRIQTDRRWSTKGSITSPKNKPCPTLLKPWKEFPSLQQQRFEEVLIYIPQDAELFSSVQYLTELGRDLCDRPLASEKDLEQYQPFAVQRPATNIISHLRTIETARRAFNLGGSIIFENHANTLSDSDDVRQRLENLRLSRNHPPSSSSSNAKPMNADQICVYKEVDGTRSPCMVVEYKPAHKLSNLHLRAGLSRADSGCMDIPADVINRITIPQDPEEKFVYISEWLVAAALTQTYGYMVENGLEYSYVATGEAFVFLRIKEDEPHTLYYHLAEPNIEAEAQDGIDIVLCRTAVSLVLVFCLMTLDSTPRSQKWRQQTLATCSNAVIDYEEVLRQFPAEKKDSTPPPSAFHARIYPFVRSPIVLRPRKSQKGRKSCGSADAPVHKDPQTPSGSSDESEPLETPSKQRNHPESNNSHASSSPSRTATGYKGRRRQYCTQACLLGLMRLRTLDETCPNVSAHRGTGSYHALTPGSFVHHIRRQLERDLDNGCEPLGKQGARGALFKLTLGSYGYTFVAKGTVEVFISDLDHEGQVYRHLDEVQGELIPVYLGNISLVHPYFLDFGVRIVHMLLMSWAGEEAEMESSSSSDLDDAIALAALELRNQGVEHHDVRPPNVLWNPEKRRVMLVDFEGAEILKQVHILQETSPNRKRKHLVSTQLKPCAAEPSYSRMKPLALCPDVELQNWLWDE